MIHLKTFGKRMYLNSVSILLLFFVFNLYVCSDESDIEGVFSLELSGRNIGTFPDIDKYINLENINLDDNKISNIKLKNVYQNIKNISLINNPIKYTYFINSFPSATIIDLRNTKISNVEVPLPKNIERFFITSDNLSIFPNIEKYENLFKVEIGNKITSIKNTKSLSLEHLTVTGSIVSFADLINFPNLKYLCIRNPWSVVIDSFKTLPLLQNLSEIDLHFAYIKTLTGLETFLVGRASLQGDSNFKLTLLYPQSLKDTKKMIAEAELLSAKFRIEIVFKRLYGDALDGVTGD